MRIEVSTGINYIRHEGSGTPVILLHGWGGSVASFKGVFDFLSVLGREVAAIDFPGFGDSPEPPESWGIYDYARIVIEFAEALGYEKFVLVGHSFGGRVAIILGKLKAVEKIVLVDSAGLKPRRGLRYGIRVGAYKLKKRLGLRPSGGSADYRALSPGMRPVFTRVVNTHLDKELKLIGCPVLILWGDEDRETPMYMAKRLEKGIADSALIVLHGGHYSYIDDAYAFQAVLKAFV